LGISALDGWGKQLRYSVTPVFTVAPISVTRRWPTNKS
jgi:hypothetical protein